MSSKPIIFNTEMVKAILDGRKTQTRRVIPLKNNDLIFIGFVVSSTAKNREGYCAFGKNKEQVLEFIKPKYKVGDILWVREPAKVIEFRDDGNYGGSWIEANALVKYLADGEMVYWNEFPENPKSWLWNCKGIPNGCCKSLARIFLKVTNVRVERLKDISDDDCIKEGIKRKIDGSGKSWYSTSIDKEAEYDSQITPFRLLWNSTAENGYKWEDNPYVFAYEFERVEK